MRRGGGEDRRSDRDKYSRGGRDGDDGRHSSRYDGERRREHRGPRDDDYAVPRPAGGAPREDGPPRGDRRGRGKGRDGMGTPERRSPTPEGAVPISQRKRKASGWDVHAPGYEQYTALQAKQTGKGPLNPPNIIADRPI